MEGIVYHHTYTRQPTSLTAARGIKRRAEDEDPQPEPDPRRVAGMFTNIPQYLWACGSNAVSGFLNLFKSDNGFSRRAPPPGTPMPTTHIESVATDHSGRKRRKILPPDFEENQPSEMSGQRRADNAPRAPSPPRFGYYPPERPITAPRPVVPYNITSSFRDTEEKRRKRLKWYHDYYSDTAIERRNRAKRARKPQDGIVPSYKSARNDEDNNKRASIRDSQVDTLLSKVQNLQGESFAQKAAVRTARVKREREEAAEREAAELLRQRDAALIAEQEAEVERVRAEAERHRRFEEEEAAFWEEHGDAVLQQMKEEEEAEHKRAAQEAASLTAEEAEIERRRAAAEAAIHEDIVVELPEKVRERLQESLAKARHDRDEITTLGPFPLGKLSFMRTLASDNGTESWLDDDTVNAWFHAIVEAKHVETSYVKGGHQPPAFTTLNTGWFTRTQKEGPKSLSRWMRRAGIAGDRILGCDRVFLPINMGSHWTLLIINGRDRSVEYLDSLGGDGGHYFTLAREILKAELGDAYLAGEWTDLKRNRSSAQSNMSDCGVFTCFNGLAAAQERQYKEVTAKKMPLARQMLAGVLINGGFVGEFYL